MVLKPFGIIQTSDKIREVFFHAARFPYARTVSLQKEVRASDAALLASRPDIRHFGEALRDFADTAALIEALDMVISIDTSVAHLAGAMGKPLWIMLPYAPDWRWLKDPDDCLWYPTARLFRQSVSGDWAGVVRRVSQALQARYAL
jgi:hypothetical protein